jgi:hypothetical protein
MYRPFKCGGRGKDGVIIEVKDVPQCARQIMSINAAIFFHKSYQTYKMLLTNGKNQYIFVLDCKLLYNVQQKKLIFEAWAVSKAKMALANALAIIVQTSILKKTWDNLNKVWQKKSFRPKV